MTVAIPAASMMSARLGLNDMRHLGGSRVTALIWIMRSAATILRAWSCSVGVPPASSNHALLQRRIGGHYGLIARRLGE